MKLKFKSYFFFYFSWGPEGSGSLDSDSACRMHPLPVPATPPKCLCVAPEPGVAQLTCRSPGMENLANSPGRLGAALPEEALERMLAQVPDRLESAGAQGL